MALGREEKISTGKLSAVQYGILGIFLLLVFGLWRLQVTGSERYEVLAEQNRIRTVPILAPRGKILDREGRIIVDNYPSFSAMLLREDLSDIDSKIPLIAQGLHLSEQDIRDGLRRYRWRPRYEPMILKEDITPDDLAFIEAHKTELPDLETLMVHRRLYPPDGFAAHLIGYIGEVSENDLNRPQFELYNPGDIVGKSGVEQQYNDILMGTDGERRAMVDSRGREVRRLSRKPATPGKTLKLTIDLDVQIAAEEALGDNNGAIVAMDPRNGEVLALVSRPTFDPNDFAVRISRDEWNRLIKDPDNPLLDKAIQAQLPPGSVFKVIMSVAGLQEGIAQNMHVNCPGYAIFYGHRYNCWIGSELHKSHGMVDITKGIYQSCDVFFYTLAERLGIGRIAKYATDFGLGQKTGIDLPEEASGTMPSEEWKIRNYKQKWFAGETISVGIGQGAVTVTPVQLARAIGGIAMGGNLVTPHVAFPDELSSLPQYRTAALNMAEKKRVPVDPANWDIITDAMAQVVTPLGTAGSAHLEGIDFAGKTGTAQMASMAVVRANKGKMKDNVWFVGVSPRRDPQIVVAVLFEHGEHSNLPAQMASKVVKAFIDKQRRLGIKTAGTLTADNKIEMGAVWNRPSESAENQQGSTPDGMQGGRFLIPVTSTKSRHRNPAKMMRVARSAGAP